MFPRKKWYRFAKPEEIASLLYSLGTDGVVPELKRAFPAATQMLKTRKWTELLLKRRFPIKSKSLLADTSTPAESAPGKVVPQQGRQKDDEDEQVSRIDIHAKNLNWLQIPTLTKLFS
jgi:hypothetical protein